MTKLIRIITERYAQKEDPNLLLIEASVFLRQRKPAMLWPLTARRNFFTGTFLLFLWERESTGPAGGL